MVNYLKAKARKLRGKKEDIELSLERAATCNTCEKFNKEMSKCGVCGCNIALLTYGDKEECSLNNWKR